MTKLQQKKNEISYILRIGVALTFVGHGVFALSVKTDWIPFLTYVGFSETSAIKVMPLIGILDFIVAAAVLFYPIRILLFWAALWAFSAALIRPLTGYPIWDFIERGANWTTPLALLLLQGWPNSFKGWFTIRDIIKD